jgi:hypothetical protein
MLQNNRTGFLSFFLSFAHSSVVYFFSYFKIGGLILIWHQNIISADFGMYAT